MDALHQKLTALQEKVDALYGLVEHTHQIALTLGTGHGDEGGQTATPMLADLPGVDLPAISQAMSHSQAVSQGLTHKDVLPDDQGWETPPDYNTNEQSLSPELQIRRLTAQVTAAYSRIAALEEQLLARRQPNAPENELNTSPSPSRWQRHRS